MLTCASTPTSPVLSPRPTCSTAADRRSPSKARALPRIPTDVNGSFADWSFVENLQPPRKIPPVRMPGNYTANEIRSHPRVLCDSDSVLLKQHASTKKRPRIPGMSRPPCGWCAGRQWWVCAGDASRPWRVWTSSAASAAPRKKHLFCSSTSEQAYLYRTGPWPGKRTTVCFPVHRPPAQGLRRRLANLFLQASAARVGHGASLGRRFFGFGPEGRIRTVGLCAP